MTPTNYGELIAFLVLCAHILSTHLDRLEARRSRAALATKVEEGTEHLSRKVDENTEVSVKAFDTANHVNEKIADLASSANEHAVATLAGLAAQIEELRLEIAKRP